MPLMIYCTAALTSFSDSVSYITFLFSEWRIPTLLTFEVFERARNHGKKFPKLCSVLEPNYLHTASFFYMDRPFIKKNK